MNGDICPHSSPAFGSCVQPHFPGESLVAPCNRTRRPMMAKDVERTATWANANGEWEWETEAAQEEHTERLWLETRLQSVGKQTNGADAKGPPWDLILRGVRQDLTEWASTLPGKRLARQPETLQPATLSGVGSVLVSSPTRQLFPTATSVVQELIAPTLGASCRASTALRMTSTTSWWRSCTI